MLEMTLDGEIELAISDAILEETLRVMREKFKRDAEQLKQAEGYIAAITRRVSPTETIDAVPSDPDDNRILECAVAAGSEVIVSGDADLLRLGGYGSIKIMQSCRVRGAPAWTVASSTRSTISRHRRGMCAYRGKERRAPAPDVKPRTVMARWTKLTTIDLAALNAKRKAAGQPAIVIPKG